MKYRSLGRSGLSVSEAGLGCEHLQGKDKRIVDEVIKSALECDMNIFDIFMSEPEVRKNIGKSLAGSRHKVLLQGHIGSIYANGQYKRSRDLKLAKIFFEDFMRYMNTDYVDIGMIHYVDTAEDWENVTNSGIADYALKLKEQGVIRCIGMSSHNPAVALKAVESGMIDVLMFSINPAYDLLPEDTGIDQLFSESTYNKNDLSGIDPKRALLYQTCEKSGVGITVMKGLGAGRLLSDKTSPFGKGLTVHQLMHYALTRPAVSSVLTGCVSKEEVYEAARYSEVDEKEKDYAFVLGRTPLYSMKGKCMYCNHCLPCPSGIDIATVTKYLDVALMNDNVIPESVAEHYKEMNQSAQDCIECGSCEKNCPFDVKVIGNMRKAIEVFGK